MDYFDQCFNREGTAEKYDLRETLFGRPDVTPMWVADTDFMAPLCVQQALADRVAHPLYGYQEARPPATLNAIQWWLKNEHNLSVETVEILLSPSVVTSMGIAIDAYTNPGDGVGFFTPVYPPFFKMAAYNDRQGIEVPLIRSGNRYHIDFEALAAALPNMRLLIFSHPHNPSGRVWSPEELKKLMDLCRDAGVIIFSDEIHSDLVHAPQEHKPLLSLGGARDCVVMAHSIGKTFNCAGLRASFMAIPCPKLRSQFFASQKKTHTDEISCFGKVALATALSEDGVAYKRALLAYLSDNIALTATMLSEGLPKIQVMVPESTFLVWVDFSGLALPREVLRCRLIDDARVAFSPGHSFGEPGDGFYRINVGLQKARLKQALTRVVRALSADEQ